MNPTLTPEAPARPAPSAGTYEPPLPEPRGPASLILLDALAGPPGVVSTEFMLPANPLIDDDFQLALYACYEMHYRGFAGVDPGWEWEPGLIGFRRRLEQFFEWSLRERFAMNGQGSRGIEQSLKVLAGFSEGPSLSKFIAETATAAQVEEFLIHRSAYQLKEADPHTWAIPRLEGRAKAAMVEIQSDEYGGGRPERMHAELFRRTLEEVGLDARYGAYLDLIPGVTLATVNLPSMLGLHRRLRGAAAGHLALFEMTSSQPNRGYGDGLRRLGASPSATDFFDEHVEADSVHEVIAVHDLAGGLAEQEPALVPDILLGARACAGLDALFAAHVVGCWNQGITSLRR